MSVIAGLKSIDIQRFAIMKILDALEIDVEEDNGVIHLADDYERTFELNNKTLRMDIGTATKGVEYSIFNPLVRIDHAHYLMILCMYSQVYTGALTFAQVKEADYNVKTRTEFGEDPCYKGMTEVYVSEIMDGTSKVCGKGVHVSEPISIVLAILDYSKKRKIVNGTTYKELLSIINDAYEDYEELSKLSSTSRRAELRERNDLLKGELPGDYDTDFNCSVYDDFDIDDNDDEDEYYEDDEDDEVEFYEEDFIEYDEKMDDFSEEFDDDDEQMYAETIYDEGIPAHHEEMPDLGQYDGVSINEAIFDIAPQYVNPMSILTEDDIPIQEEINEDMINITPTSNFEYIDESPNKMQIQTNMQNTINTSCDILPQNIDPFVLAVSGNLSQTNIFSLSLTANAA